MYNRYVRKDTEEHRRAEEKRSEPSHNTAHHAARDGGQPGTNTAPLGGLFSGILGKLNLSDMDTGDILLLLLIFLLFREGGDEELLIALGLLLIL